MKKILPITAALITALGLTACNNTLSEQEARLNEIIAKTQTTDKIRSVEWYQNNDFVRNDVIQACMEMVERKVAEVNAIGGELKYEYIDKQVNKNQDCLNARQANINIEIALDKNRITYNEYNMRLNQYKQKVENTELSEEERAQAKAFVDSIMKEMDDKGVARQGEDKFTQLQKMAQQDIQSQIETTN